MFGSAGSNDGHGDGESVSLTGQQATDEKQQQQTSNEQRATFNIEQPRGATCNI